MHPNYSDELANGVAVSFDPIYDEDGKYYVNTQIGEDLVTNPDALSTPEEIRLASFFYSVLAISNQVPQGQLLMSDAQLYQLHRHLTVIHDEFATLYGVGEDEQFAMEIEFKITSDNILAIKQARPWVFDDALTRQPPATGAPTIIGTAQVGETLTADTSGITDVDGLDNATFSYQWIANSGTTDTDITGATNATYTLVAADEGKTIKVRVSFTDDAGNAETLTSAATAAVEPEVTQEPPAQPQGLAGTVAHDAVSLTWDDPSDATITGYQILRRDRALHAIGYFLVHVGDTGSAATSYVDRDVSPETLYGYRVKARNAAGLSERSYYFNADIPPAPDPPPDLTDLGDITDLAKPMFPGGTLDGATVSYRFELTGRKKVGLGLRGQETNADLVVEDADGNVLRASRNGGTTNEWLTIVLLAGTYYVRLEAQEPGASEFTFRYGVEAVPNSPATGAPTISGTAQVGETLTASTSAIADADGLTSAAFSYQWLSNDTDIQGATGSTYTLTAADAGNAVKVRVSFTDDAGNAERLTSAATAAVTAKPNSPATVAPVIGGTAQVGETLTASTSAIADEDGLGNASFSYQWLSDDADIQGATVSTYTLTASDEGNAVKVRVSFTDDEGNGESVTSGPTAAVAAKPNSPANGAPTITGTAQVDETLTVDTSAIADEDGLGNASFSYQWISDDTDIQGATGSAYTLTASDEGNAVKVRVSFTDDEGNGESVTSGPTAAVASRPNSPATGAPVIGGTAQVGETLTASTSAVAVADGLTSAAFSYQWLSDDIDIQNATGSTYTLTAADAGNAVKVRVSFTDDAGNAETLTSAATAAIAAKPNSPARGAPTITGTAQVGETLTASTSAIDDADGLGNASFKYQWTSNDTDIQGATGVVYTLASSDEGNAVKVRVNFTDDAGNAETLTSAATATVAAKPPVPPASEPPAQPRDFNVVWTAAGTIALTWDDPGDASITGYQILRANPGLGDMTLEMQVRAENTGNAATTFTDTDVTAGVLYMYQVKAINSAGLSEESFLAYAF